MYRIELSPGEETAFRTIEELAVAIRRKVVTSRARIYHNATSRWLPIQFHPHYQIALSMPLTQADLVAGPPVTPLSKLKLGEAPSAAAPAAPSTREAAAQAALTAWPEPKPSVPTQPLSRTPPEEILAPKAPVRAAAPEPPPQRAVEPRPAMAADRRVEPERRSTEGRARIRLPVRKSERRREAEPVRARDSVRAQSPRRRRKPQRPLRVALAGAVLIACAHLVVSGTPVPPSDTPVPGTARQLIRLPAEASVTPRTVAAVMPGLQSIPVPGFHSPAPASSGPAAGTQPGLPVPETRDSVPSPEVELEAAPDPGGITANGPVAVESLAPQVVDSSGKKALKGILRTISGSPAGGAKSPKR